MKHRWGVSQTAQLCFDDQLFGQIETTSVFIDMDPSAPRTVLKGVAITCKFVPCLSSSQIPTLTFCPLASLCGTVAGLYGGFKHGAPGKFLLYSAVNGGIVAATFFSCVPDLQTIVHRD